MGNGAVSSLLPRSSSTLPTNREGRGFNPAVVDASNCFPSPAPRRPAPAGLRGAGDELEGGSRFAAGLKPRPSGPATKNGRAW